MDREQDSVKVYKAIICIRDTDGPSRRVSVLAKSLEQAREKLEAEYGEGTVFNLHNEADAAQPR